MQPVANLSYMRSPRSLVTFVAVLCLVLADPGIAAPARDNPYWTSETTLPAETITGEWSVSDDGKSAELRISGANLPGQSTTFEAGWVTPWHRGRWFSEEGQIDLLITPGTSVTLKKMTRYQEAGHRWSPWYKRRLPYDSENPFGGGAWASGQGFAVPVNRRAPKVRYEWRLVGEIEGSAHLSSTINLSLN